MKKLEKILVFILLLFSFSINVYAEGETNNPTEGETTGEGESTEQGETGETTDPTDTLKAELTNIKVNGTNVVCNDNKVCEYIIKDNSVKSVKVTYDVSDGTADPESGFTKEIEEGTTDFKVVVTSEDKKNTYTFKITKKIVSTDSSLKKLTVNGQEITLKEDTLKYQTSVSYTTKKVEIEAIPKDEKTKVIDFNNNKASFDFFESSKEFKIKVQAEDGSLTTYSVTVTKRSEADVTLKSLTIKNHKIDFSSEVTDYELKVLKNVSKLEIEAKATDSKANVKITNPTLQIGENTIKIEVSNDGNTNTYTIKVTKLNEDDKTLGNLKSLKIEGYELEFSPDKYEYNLYIEDDNYLVINAIAKMEEAEVEITGNLDLVDGSIIKIKVTYDEDIYNVYRINISKEGTNIAKKRISKKAIALVILFDVLAMVVLGIVHIKEKIGKQKNNQDQTKNNNTKKNNVLDNLDDVDII